MVQTAPIRIEGLDRFRAGLRGMDRGLPRALRLALNEAAQLVVDDAVPNIPRLTGRAAVSVRVASSQAAVRVRAGGAKVPYYPWLDFGGKVGRNRSVDRAFFSEGRYIWKSFASKRDEVQATLQRALIGLAESSGLDVT